MTAKYRLLIEPRARKHLAHVDPVIRRRIAVTVDALGTDPEPSGCKALRGVQGPLSILRRRVGDYRILYVIDREESTVTVVDIDHRKDIYR